MKNGKTEELYYNSNSHLEEGRQVMLISNAIPPLQTRLE